MSFFGKFSLGALLALLLAAGNGCIPGDASPLDEEKEPHFVLGKSRVNAMDYAGALEAFNEALEANPRSAAAHFQMACLFDTKESDPSAAIYHYQEFLRLNPKADNAEVIRQRIYSCKQQLAADVLPLPSAPCRAKTTGRTRGKKPPPAGRSRKMARLLHRAAGCTKKFPAACAGQSRARRQPDAG